MTRKKIDVPSRLTFQNSIDFVRDLRALEPHKEIEFDFSNLSTIDPFSLLLVSSEIQRCRSRFEESKFIATHFDHCTYPAHMGFFQAFGMNFGKRPGEAKGSSTYIPINIYNTREIKQDARELMINPAELLESKAKEISNVLTRSEKGHLNEVLTYC